MLEILKIGFVWGVRTGTPPQESSTREPTGVTKGEGSLGKESGQHRSTQRCGRLVDTTEALATSLVGSLVCSTCVAHCLTFDVIYVWFKSCLEDCLKPGFECKLTAQALSQDMASNTNRTTHKHVSKTFGNTKPGLPSIAGFGRRYTTYMTIPKTKPHYIPSVGNLLRCDRESRHNPRPAMLLLGFHTE